MPTPISTQCSWRLRSSLGLFLAFALLVAGAPAALAQLELVPDEAETDTVQSEADEPGQEVLVEPVADDSAIEARLQRILEASEWFQQPRVEVSEGIAFLDGVTENEERREWAGRLARTTQDVVAVINRIEVRPSVEWDFEPAWDEVRNLAQQGQRVLPLLALALVVFFITWLVAKLVARLARAAFRKRVSSPLLLTVLARAFAIPVVLLGLYLILQVAGLTRLALTVLGGTGLLGLVLGFAFRDIAENFLASLLLSIRNPFAMGDLVRIGDNEGIVRNLNTRSTRLFTLDGNHVQIPNATVYKSVITNYSTNPSRRSDFTLGIGYDDSTSAAQAIISDILAAHPAVKAEPMPLVLIDQLASSTVNLKVYFWFDSGTYSPIKLRSALMRQTKDALLKAGISMPDEAREVIFPKGLPIYRVSPPGREGSTPADAGPAPAPALNDLPASAAEGGLANDDILKEEPAPTASEARENLLTGRKPSTGAPDG